MLNIIVAPKDKVRAVEKVSKKIVKYLKDEKVEYLIYFSRTFDEMVTIVEELKNNLETEFILIGDDISISHFVNEVKELSKIKLGIIPVGKNDDFAKFLELETNPISAIQKILAGNLESVDYLVVNDIIAINNISIGASTSALEEYERYKWRTNLTKKHALYKYGTKFEGIELIISTKNNKSETYNIFELSICNGAYLKGQPISPLSNIKDGLFNLNYITVENAIDKKKTLKSYLSGDHIYNEQTKQVWINNTKITTNNDEDFHVSIDGRLYSVDELNITLVENGLKLYK